MDETFGVQNVVVNPVSYTHLDVYKRQLLARSLHIKIQTLENVAFENNFNTSRDETYNR